MSQRTIDLSLSTLAAFAGVLLSWPFFRDHRYWAESPEMWWVYIGTGFLLAIYVFYVFVICLRTLFAHDALGKQAPINGKDEGRAP
ncbi:MAG: hypothetical protein EPN56_05880 [Rhodanobacter sp.]|nr:MAG: hypothetical protein EPN78_00935 [Rhodanobacter sp.]TAM15036.1 MAG: hypothetical protein EPN66_00305 [Rhodanobacter sp.]TAM36494.1 MAG: hypothetical protein EPN56_05880 [Rhodanobacter sp.]